MNEEPSGSAANQSGTETVEIARPAKRLRRALRIVLSLIVLAGLVIWGIFMLSRPCDRTRATYSTIKIEEGDSLYDASELLEEEGIIRKASEFRLLSKIFISGNIRPGTYFLSPSMDSVSILDTLTSGLTTSEGFTIPAGYTVEQTATALARDGIVDKDEFLKAASSDGLRDFDILSEGSKGLKGSDLVEGFLFPSDYVLSADADESMIIIMMVDAFSNYFNEDYRARADELGISIRQVLIIASMIEKETSLDKERTQISAVLHNRYNLEMDDKKTLPEKPLCSPGKKSIEAALYPEENEYTYYVLSSKLDGSHKFTSDKDEYEQWLKEYEEAVEARKDIDQ